MEIEISLQVNFREKMYAFVFCKFDDSTKPAIATLRTLRKYLFFQKMIDQCAMKWKKHMMKARRQPHFSLEAAEAVFKQATRGDEDDRCENSGLQFPAFSLSLKQTLAFFILPYPYESLDKKSSYHMNTFTCLAFFSKQNDLNSNFTRVL